VKDPLDGLLAFFIKGYPLLKKTKIGAAKVQTSKEYQQRKSKFYDHILDNKQQ
jgi:hypothetical protein